MATHSCKGGWEIWHLAGKSMHTSRGCRVSIKKEKEKDGRKTQLSHQEFDFIKQVYTCIYVGICLF